ncbi:extensin-like domain-containing protein [Ancylobacter defluvii]|uniref:Extensin-like C-terminal domain-containing protein n=1 Tax=Ancylobacter defluvii TaxID=1282440 RepID=A0A9W6JVS6_9HYPH|nr:extensin family protein [Ancylobacter defluvii]MBS7589878.1 extensin family protein [Ancylobacter defluvii]GLK83000.1 hypothetical protein GCM10017653_10690 [Ancylobacter defluvii]
MLSAPLPGAQAQQLAQAQELKSSIDRAGSAASQQIEQWLGAPAPKPARKPRTKPATGARSAATVPLPPPRPIDEPPDEAAEEPAAAPAGPIAKPAAKPAVPPLFAARPAQPAGPVTEPVDEEPALAEAPGIPLPPQRPERVAPLTPALAAQMPRPPARPRIAAVTPPAAGDARQSPSPEASEPEDAETEAAETDAAGVPLPPPRPQGRTQTAMLSPAATAPPPGGSALTPPPGPLAGCPELTVGDLGTITTAEVKTSPACRIERPVSLTGIKLKDGRLIPLEPAATLRCDMAAAVARWVREGVAPAVETLGSPLAKIQVADSYSCRPRNRVKGAKISEHGSGNAMDTRGYTLMDGRSVLVGGSGAQAMPLAFQELLKASACADFMTILGPGSDGFHELHLHVDRAVRRNNMVLCRWAIGTRPPGARTETGKSEADKPGKARAGDAKSNAPGSDESPGNPSAASPSPSQETEPGDEESTDAAESDAPAASAGAGRGGGGRK